MPDVLYQQRDQPPGVPPLALTGERTLPDVPEENYWYRRHLAVYEWIAERVWGRRVVDLACGEGYGSAGVGGGGPGGGGSSIWPAARATARRCWRGAPRRSSAWMPTPRRSSTRG